MEMENVNAVGTMSDDDGEYICVFVSKFTDKNKKYIPKELDGYRVLVTEIGDIGFQ